MEEPKRYLRQYGWRPEAEDSALVDTDFVQDMTRPVTSVSAAEASERNAKPSSLSRRSVSVHPRSDTEIPHPVRPGA